MTIELKVYAVTDDICFYVVVPCMLLDEEFAKWKEEELENAREKCDDYFEFL